MTNKKKLQKYLNKKEQMKMRKKLFDEIIEIDKKRKCVVGRKDVVQKCMDVQVNRNKFGGCKTLFLEMRGANNSIECGNSSNDAMSKKICGSYTLAQINNDIDEDKTNNEENKSNKICGSYTLAQINNDIDEDKTNNEENKSNKICGSYTLAQINNDIDGDKTNNEENKSNKICGSYALTQINNDIDEDKTNNEENKSNKICGSYTLTQINNDIDGDKTNNEENKSNKICGSYALTQLNNDIDEDKTNNEENKSNKICGSYTLTQLNNDIDEDKLNKSDGSNSSEQINNKTIVDKEKYTNKNSLDISIEQQYENNNYELKPSNQAEINDEKRKETDFITDIDTKSNTSKNKDKTMSEHIKLQDAELSSTKQMKDEISTDQEIIKKDIIESQLQTSIDNNIPFSQDDEHKPGLQSKTIQNNISLNKHNSNIYECIKKEYIVFKRNDKIEEQRRKLPIYFEETNIISEISNNDIIFIRGETGSGKTTQIPQFLLENGFSSKHNMIGLTQPRRISAISVSNRINEELNEKLSSYKIKYEDTTNKCTKIKVMTDGILLKELKNDYVLKKYSVIILDEIHERSINIDILISILIKIVEIRKTSENRLKLILMSATMDNNLYEFVFSDKLKVGSCYIEPQKYNISIFYENKTDINYLNVAYDKIKKILSMENYKEEASINTKIIRSKKRTRNEYNCIERLPKGVLNNENSGILVFLPSKEDIYKLYNKINDDKDIDVIAIPLHAGLSFEEQKKVFQKTEKRKIILSTNIAESSITIPGVVFVIDTGRAKYKRLYNGTFSYEIDFICKTSATQRSGRTGRTSNGICYRLYSGKMYDEFDAYKDPEILNTPLDSLVLDLKAFGINEIDDFDFITEPPKCQIILALEKLKSLGAIDEQNKITELGIKMSGFPLSPRLQRLVCMKSDQEKEIGLIASILSIDFDVSKNHNNSHYFMKTKSDVITKMLIIIDFYNSKSKNEFCRLNMINKNNALEIIKMYFYIMKLKKIDDTSFVNKLDENCIVKLRQIIYFGFCDNMARRIGNSFFYSGKEVFFSKECVEIDGECVVFDFLVLGKKTYMKNVTLVEL